jgi:hypothetical protein
LQVHAVSAELLTTELEMLGQFTHVSELVAPSVTEYVPTEQSVQTALPLALLYLPAAHAAHTPASGPVNPCRQRHAAIDVLEIAELEFAGHDVQLVSATRPLNLPASQTAQVPSHMTP